ncbi:LOW QUALITY PROTEIN: hypothetical protein HID58_022565, partial [Brassica napus]
HNEFTKIDLLLVVQAALVFKSTNSEHVIKPTFPGVHMIINRKCESWNINLVVMESLYHLKLGESYYFSTKYSRSSCDLDGSGLNQYQTLSAAMKNTAIESVNKKWEGSKNATLQLVDMECSYLTVDFFRKLSTALRMPSVLLHCGRCDSVQRILLMLRYEIVTAYTLANGGLAMKSTGRGEAFFEGAIGGREEAQEKKKKKRYKREKSVKLDREKLLEMRQEKEFAVGNGTWEWTGCYTKVSESMDYLLFEVYTLAGMVISPNSRGITIGDLGSIVFFHDVVLGLCEAKLRNTSKGSNIVLIQVILALKYFSAFVFSEGHISAIVSQFRLSSLALMLCSDIYCLLLYYKMISIQDEPNTMKGLFCKPSLTRTILPLQDDLKVVQAKFAKTEVVQDEGLDSRDHWSRVMKGHTGDNMVSY